MSKPEYVKALEKDGCIIHREYTEYGKTIYVVEKNNTFAKLTRDYDRWYEVKHGQSLMNEEDFMNYTLKTKAKSGEHRYKVVIKKGFNDREWSLSIEDTPATWYLSTLFEDYSPEQERISIYGNDWICENYDEIMKEVCDHLKWRVERFVSMKGDC